MKKTVLSLITVMVLGTTVCFAQTQDEKKCDKKCDKQEQCDRKGGPRRPPMGPRIQATEGCTCATCEQIRKMEKEMEERRAAHKGCDCKKDSGACKESSECKQQCDSSCKK